MARSFPATSDCARCNRSTTAAFLPEVREVLAVRAERSATASVDFMAIYWIRDSPFTITSGALALALFSFLAATYLTVEAEGDVKLQDDFRRRALWAAGAAVAAALVALR